MVGTRTCSVLELRQYTLLPHRRDAFIDLFDEKFVETQAAAGIRVFGQFRDLNRPEAFVWLRGFRTMRRRRAALERFYGGAAWAEHGRTANSYISDSDNVLLLRPVAQRRLDNPIASKPETGILWSRSDMLTSITVIATQSARVPEILGVYEHEIVPLIEEVDGDPVAELVTEAAKNTFPRLPVREDAYVLVIITRHQRAALRCGAIKMIDGKLRELLSEREQRTLDGLLLEPTSGSALR